MQAKYTTSKVCKQNLQAKCASEMRNKQNVQQAK